MAEGSELDSAGTNRRPVRLSQLQVAVSSRRFLVSSAFRILSKSILILLLTTFVPAILFAQRGPLPGSIRAGHSSPATNSVTPVSVSSGAWSQLGQLVPNVSNFVVAYSVAIDGDTIVVGAFPTLTKDNAAAYVFTKPANGWSNLHSVASLIVPLVGGASSVAIQGDTIVVGVTNYSYGPGGAYIFEKPAGGWTDMNPTATLSSTDSMTGDSFGGSVALDGSTVVVGSTGADSATGAAYIYAEPAGGWSDMTETAKLTLSGTPPDSGFPETVSLSGNTIVCGAVGGAYVYVEPSAGWADMTQTAKLSTPGGAKTFFESVSISSNTILAGTVVGSAYLFVEPVAGWTNMTQTATLTAGDGDPDFGNPVLLNGNTAVVGDGSRTVGPNTEEGGAYIFSEPKGGWKNMSSTTVLTASDARHYSRFGDAIAMSGNTLVLGAPAFKFSGTAFVFGLP
jgi:FG-GAP repeat